MDYSLPPWSPKESEVVLFALEQAKGLLRDGQSCAALATLQGILEKYGLRSRPNMLIIAEFARAYDLTGDCHRAAALLALLSIFDPSNAFYHFELALSLLQCGWVSTAMAELSSAHYWAIANLKNKLYPSTRLYELLPLGS